MASTPTNTPFLEKKIIIQYEVSGQHMIIPSGSFIYKTYSSANMNSSTILIGKTFAHVSFSIRFYNNSLICSAAQGKKGDSIFSQHCFHAHLISFAFQWSAHMEYIGNVNKGGP